MSTSTHSLEPAVDCPLGGGRGDRASDARAALDRILASSPRFWTTAQIAAHRVVTVGLALVIHPAAVDLWVYAAHRHEGELQHHGGDGDERHALAIDDANPADCTPGHDCAEHDGERDKATAEADLAKSKATIVADCAKAHVSALGALFDGESAKDQAPAVHLRA